MASVVIALWFILLLCQSFFPPHSQPPFPRALDSKLPACTAQTVDRESDPYIQLQIWNSTVILCCNRIFFWHTYHAGYSLFAPPAPHSILLHPALFWEADLCRLHQWALSPSLPPRREIEEIPPCLAVVGSGIIFLLEAICPAMRSSSAVSLVRHPA